MDLTNPARSIYAPVPADVLVVLERTHSPLTGATVARLAGRSYARVHEVLRRLVDAGLVEATRAGQATLYTFNRDHILAPAVSVASTAHQTLMQRITERVSRWSHPPITVALFGSAARRDGSPTSDIDVLLVRPDDVEHDDDQWLGRRHELLTSIDRWTGNSAQVVELSVAELQEAARRRDSLIASILDAAGHAWGSPVRELINMAHTR